MSDEEKIVVLFKKYEDLKSDEARIVERFEEEWGKAHTAFDLAEVGIANIEAELPALEKAAQAAGAALAKSGNTTDTLKQIKADMALLSKRLEIQQAKQAAMRGLLNAKREALDERNGKMFGLGDLAKRSLRFAKAQQRHYYGPAATVAKIGVKQYE